MRHAGEETEAKFLVALLQDLERRLADRGAQLVQGRTHEINYCFDTTDGALADSGRVLRLRRDTAFRLTYKDSRRSDEGLVRRRQLEFSVSDVGVAKDLLLALGYVVVFTYEKFRTT